MTLAEIILKAGGVTAMARALGVHHSSILGWARVPAERVPAVSRITGVPRHELRPDLWEAPTAQQTEAA